MGDMIQLRRGSTRLFLKSVDDSYGDQAYIDVKTGMTTGEQRELSRLGRVIDTEYAEYQRWDDLVEPILAERERIAAFNADAEVASGRRERMPLPELPEKPDLPPLSDAYYDARDAQYALYALDTNVTHDGEGKPLPRVSELGFWQLVGQDVKNAVIAHFQAERARRDQRQRLDGQAFTKPPTGSS